MGAAITKVDYRNSPIANHKTTLDFQPPRQVNHLQKTRPQIKDINFHYLSLKDDIGHFSLKEAYSHFVLDLQDDIPFLIWLLENPNSALALPGKVDLYGHDCIHLMLNRGKSNFDEAFVIGFTMGNCPKLKSHHLKIFKTFASRFYPAKFRFNRFHLKSFELGLAYGESLETKNIHLVNFDLYADSSIQAIRDSLGICLDELKNICYAENLWAKPLANFITSQKAS